MENKLVKIEKEEWENLRALYLPETPETILGFSTISNYIRWNKICPQIDDLTIYCLNGSWSDGLFVVVDRYHIYFDSLSEKNDRLLILLDLLDYSKGFRFMHVRSKHQPVMLEIIKRKQLSLEYDHQNLLYYLSREQAIKLHANLPDEFYSRKLSNADVITANAKWPFSHPGSLYYLQRLAILNPSCGVFTKEANELISFAFQFQTSPLGTLHTEKPHQKRGLATFVVRSMFKQIAELGCGVTACVNKNNLASRAIFEKIGCQVIDEIQWIATPCDWSEENIKRIKCENLK